MAAAAVGFDVLHQVKTTGSGQCPTPLPAPATPLVTISGLHKSFGNLTVLDGVDLEIARGERVSIIGPSGSGKTTLLRCINYLERPTAGEIRIEGQLIGQVDGPRGRRELSNRAMAGTRAEIGFVFQRFNLFPHLSALENVALAPKLVRKLPQQQARALAVEMLEKVGLGHKLDQFPERLSGGQQQRVAIARVLAMKPKLLLFDEPTSALDPELVGEVLGVMRRLADEGRTMIVVTHEIRFAGDVSDRIIFMDGGRIVEQGPPKTLLRSPAHERTRSFLRKILEQSE
jgi:ABC-type polar amino acid transport system ATPase subunit